MIDNAGNATTQAVIAFVHGLDAAALPPAVRRECGRTLVNAMGCMVGGGQHAIVQTARAALGGFSGPPTASLLGRGEQTDPLHAALLNGTAAAAYSYFDTYSSAFVHPGTPVLAGLLAAAEHRAASGQPASGLQFMSAFAAGVETACRLTKALALPPAQGQTGWSTSGVMCGPATALACARLLGLDAARTGWALGIAVSQASGTRATIGSMAGSLVFGLAAQAGLRAALLAAQGFTSTDGILEHRAGFAHLFSTRPHLPALTNGGLQTFELLHNTYKPYPCDVVNNPAIDAMLQCRAQHGLDDAARIERITLHVCSSAIAFAARPDPVDEMQAKFSLHHWVAAAAVRGKAGIAEGTLAVVNDPQVRRLRARIDVHEDATLSPEAARLTLRLGDGRTLECHVEHCSGSLRNPMSDAQLDAKCTDQAAINIGAARAQALLAACKDVERLPDAAALARLGC